MAVLEVKIQILIEILFIVYNNSGDAALFMVELIFWKVFFFTIFATESIIVLILMVGTLEIF